MRPTAHAFVADARRQTVDKQLLVGQVGATAGTQGSCVQARRTAAKHLRDRLVVVLLRGLSQTAAGGSAAADTQDEGRLGGRPSVRLIAAAPAT
jgi:hypothetical protein